MRRWIAVLLLSAVTAAPAAEPDVARQAELHDLLSQDCGSCHGLTLRGGLGPALLRENLAGRPTAFLVQTILDGRPGTAMPPWRPLLSEADAVWLVEQLLNGEVAQ